MRIGTIVSLGASAVLGVGALLVAKVWLPMATHSNEARAPAVAPATVPVVVASRAIAYGAKLEASNLSVARLPAAAVPEGAYATIAQVLGGAGATPIALTEIAAREPILPGKLSGPGARATLAAMIADGMRAFTIGVTDVAGGGGHVMPGDRVDVVLTRDLADTSGEAGSGKRLVSNVVIQNVRILGMDLNADPTSTTAAVAHTATLEVTVGDAEKLALAGQAGVLSLALRRTGAAEIAAVGGVSAADLGPGGAAMGARAPRLIQARQRGAKPAPARRSISVVHGDAKTSVEVPADRGAGV